MNQNVILHPCPFCGHAPDVENLCDSLHPVTRDRSLWTFSCVDNEGGCNASVLADSEESAIEAWNRRSPNCKCPACISASPHLSDCAVHNAPAYRLGPCDCGASGPAVFPADDEVIELAAALEQQRAYRIVADVAALRIGNPAELPTPFEAGYQLACEEIEHRLRTEQWELADDVYAPINVL